MVLVERTDIDIAGSIDTRLVSSEITIQEDLTADTFIRRAVTWAVDHGSQAATTNGAGVAATADKTHAAVAGRLSYAVTTGAEAHAVSAGISSPAVTIGAASHAATTESRSCAVTLGNASHALAAGGGAEAVTNGEKSHAVVTGGSASAVTAGANACAAAVGFLNRAATSGDHAHAAKLGATGAAMTRGHHASAAALGNRSIAHTSGDHAVAIGEESRAFNNGLNGIACSLGPKGLAGGRDGNWIILASYDKRGNVTDIRAAKVGTNGIKSGRVYCLNRKGRFEEHIDPRETFHTTYSIEYLRRRRRQTLPLRLLRRLLGYFNI